MESNLFRYILKHTRREQVWIVCIVLLSMIPFYMALDLPKQIVNGPITGIGFDEPGATLPFMRFEYDLPLIGHVVLAPGIELERLPLLLALSFAFLAMVVINGLFKVYINIYRGRLGERLLRRIRFELVDRLLRFPPGRLKSLKAGEVASMVKDEVEPLGGFTSEAFVTPVRLVGQTLTALAFIFVQHFWLGALALMMAMIQVMVIPRLRRRLIILGRERQLTARQLAGRVAEIVDGIDSIHVSDTTNYVRADIAARLGRIFKIRYDIYQWKFFVKFLNNFIAQMTPFLFYLIGGYLTITGRLDVGQLVAVINAYRELPGPMKELIDWDLARQDIQVKYEQVIDQFSSDSMIDPALQSVEVTPATPSGEPLKVSSVTLADETGTTLLSSTTLTFDPGEAVGFVGSGSSGSSALAEAIARIMWPTTGHIELGKTDVLQLPESISGRRVSYASSETFFFAGSIEENLTYVLKNAPRRPASYEGPEAEHREWELMEAERSGNPTFDLNDDWIDEEALLNHTGATSYYDALLKVLDIVELRQDIVDLAGRARLDPVTDADMAEEIVKLRGEYRRELDKHGLIGTALIPFEPGVYNDEASIGQNLLFGQVVDQEGALLKIVSSEFFRNTLRDSGLGEQMYRAGHAIAEIKLNLLQDLPPDHMLFQRMQLFDLEELPEIQRLIQRAGPDDFENVSRDDRSALMRICALYSENKYRFGVLTDEMKGKIVEVRETLQKGLPEDLRGLIEHYDPEKYMFAAGIRENILFGLVNSRMNNADERIQEIGNAILSERPDLYNRLLHFGLAYDIGPGGRRLSSTQRYKLNLARTLLRSSDLYILNRPMLGMGRAEQTRIITASLEFLREREPKCIIIWVLADEYHAQFFDRVVRFDAGSVIEDSPKEAYLEKKEAV